MRGLTRMKSKKLTARRWKRSDDWSSDAQWEGTAMIYVVRDAGSFALSGAYRVDFDEESEPEDLRANRLYRASQGSRVDEVAEDKLSNELVVIFGVKMTATKAVSTLKALIARIEDDGLIVGRVGGG